MARDRTKTAPFDRQEILQEALGLLARFGTKKKAERAAMHRQANSIPASPQIGYWFAVAQAIRKMK
jgi:hypothetical protein